MAQAIVSVCATHLGLELQPHLSATAQPVAQRHRHTGHVGPKHAPLRGRACADSAATAVPPEPLTPITQIAAPCTPPAQLTFLRRNLSYAASASARTARRATCQSGSVRLHHAAHSICAAVHSPPPPPPPLPPQPPHIITCTPRCRPALELSLPPEAVRLTGECKLDRVRRLGPTTVCVAPSATSLRLSAACLATPNSGSSTRRPALPREPA
jgi:hypothetical protein